MSVGEGTSVKSRTMENINTVKILILKDLKGETGGYEDLVNEILYYTTEKME